MQTPTRGSQGTFIKGHLICDAAGEHRHINLAEMRKQREADGRSGGVGESQGPALIPPVCFAGPGTGDRSGPPGPPEAVWSSATTAQELHF